MMKKPLFVLSIFMLIAASMMSLVSAAVNLNSPADSSIEALETVSFKFTPDLGSGFTSCGLYTNKDGSYALAGSLSSVSNGAINTINLTFSDTKKAFSWYVSCTDGTVVTNSSTRKVYVISDTKLAIYEIKVKYEEQESDGTDSQTETFDLDDILSGGLSISSVAQNSDVEVTIYAKNYYSTSLDEDDTVIEDITVDIESDDSSDIDDVDGDLDDLDAGDKDSVKLTFNIPGDLLEDEDSDEFGFTITVEGEDGTGDTQSDEVELTLEVKKPKYMINLESATISDSVISCDRSFSVRTKFSNAGYKDLDEAMIQIYSKDLGIAYVENDLELDADATDYTTIEAPFNIKDSVSAGKYTIYVKIFQTDDEDDLMDGGVAMLSLEVQKCVQTTTTKPTTTTDNGSQTSTTSTTSTNNGKTTSTTTQNQNDITSEYKPITTTPVSVKEESDSSEILTIGLLVGVNVVLLVAGIFLVLKLTRK